MTDVERDQQARAWEMRLLLLGVPESKLRITRRLGERIMSQLEALTNETDIEETYGFGDYNRGIATIAAIVAVDWVGTPSA